ncbi:MAG: deoxyribose-phosphate aldolase, partial [Bacteroidales bacterium]|nr:deoxyribose-phosphate aldolase [Bacteroidales bacterium]
LKVILEVGELNTLSNIMKASLIALENGADFIKTSTGKIAQGADIYSVCVMLLALRKHYFKQGVLKGLKVSGGIRTCSEALQYRHLFDTFINKEIKDNTYFRIGCSRLFENIQEKILNIK